MSPLGNEGRNCKKLSCNYPFVKKCPQGLIYKSLYKNKEYEVACSSPCQVFKTDEYCCRGKYEGQNCDPTKWPTNFAKIFKDKCPDAKTYLQDNKNIWHSCKANKYSIIIEDAGGNKRWRVVFDDDGSSRTIEL